LISELTREGKPLFLRSRETWAVMGLVSWAVATIPFSYWPGGSLDVLTGAYGKALIIFWLLGLTVNTPQRLYRTAWMLTLMGIPLAHTGVHNYMTGNFMSSNSFGRIAGYEGALTSNPNDLALMLNLILPLTIALLAIQQGFFVRLFLCGVIVLSAVAIVCTHSRGGFLTIGVIFVFYSWKLIRRRKPAWPIAILIAVLLAAPLLPKGYLSRMDTITDIDADETGSAQQRWEMMTAGAGYVVEHPLIGAGLGMNGLALNEMLGPIWHEVHNVFLQYAMDLGIPGLVLYLAMLVSALQSTMVVCRRSAGIANLRSLFHLSEGLQGSLCAFIVGAFFAPVAYNLYFYYFAGLAIGAREALAPMSDFDNR
jgi:O-antigen ligase